MWRQAFLLGAKSGYDKCEKWLRYLRKVVTIPAKSGYDKPLSKVPQSQYLRGFSDFSIYSVSYWKYL